MPGLLCARVLRCLHPQARLVSLHVEGGASLPGVIRIVTAADIPGLNGFPEHSCDEPVLTPSADAEADDHHDRPGSVDVYVLARLVAGEVPRQRRTRTTGAGSGACARCSVVQVGLGSLSALGVFPG